MIACPSGICYNKKNIPSVRPADHQIRSRLHRYRGMRKLLVLLARGRQSLGHLSGLYRRKARDPGNQYGIYGAVPPKQADQMKRAAPFVRSPASSSQTSPLPRLSLPRQLKPSGGVLFHAKAYKSARRLKKSLCRAFFRKPRTPSHRPPSPHARRRVPCRTPERLPSCLRM